MAQSVVVSILVFAIQQAVGRGLGLDLRRASRDDVNSGPGGLPSEQIILKDKHSNGVAASEKSVKSELSGLLILVGTASS